MLAATHAIAGALFASQFNNPAAGLSAAFLSHPLLDLFPHWDFNSRFANYTKRKKFIISAADSAAGMAAGLLLFGTRDNFFYLILVMLVAQWADFLEAPYHFGFENMSFFRKIKHMQHYWHTKAGWPWGFLPQLGIFLLALWLRYRNLLVF